MSFFLLYVGEGRTFDHEAVASTLRTLEGAKPLQPAEDCLWTYHYEHGHDFTTIRFKKDRETIVIDGSGEASVSAALQIQSAYPEAIHLIDEGYNFDLVLRGIASVKELARRIEQASK